MNTRNVSTLTEKKSVIEKAQGAELEWIPSKRRRQQVRLMADSKLNIKIKESRRSSEDQTPPDECHDEIVEFFRQNTKDFVETLEKHLPRSR